MISMHVAALVLAAAGGGETVLLDFHADWCGPCRTMEPVVEQMIASGYPVRKVNVGKERELAAKYRIEQIPCFVLVSNGREIDRVLGARSRGELEAMFSKARLERTASHTPGRSSGSAADGYSTGGGYPGAGASGGPPPLAPVSFPATAAQAPFSPGQTGRHSEQDTPDDLRVQSGPAAKRALEASVRLTVEDPDGISYGSGTIIDARSGEALILTCGHIFRSSQGRGKILVDTFSGQGATKLPGRLLSFDDTRDVGLVIIRTSAPVTVARMAPRGHRPRVGEPVVSVGCNNGAGPTAIESRVNSLNKFQAPANIQVAGQPVQGRSGGGLFDSQGYVIGVCNAADPQDNEGLFAAPETIQQELDRVGLTALYEAPADGGTGTSLAADDSWHPGGARAAESPRDFGAASRVAQDAVRQGLAAVPSAAELRRTAQTAIESATPDQREALASLASADLEAEVICLVRPKGEPKSNYRVIVLDRVSPALLESLTREQAGPHLTSLDVPRGAARTCPIDGRTPVGRKPAGRSRSGQIEK